MKKSILLFAFLLISGIAFSQHRKISNSSRSKKVSSKSISNHNGRFIGGHGSSHYGGQYHSRIGNGDRYKTTKRPKK